MRRIFPRLDIENKIMIPFMILSILPIIILGVVSYWNGYQMLYESRLALGETTLKQSTKYFSALDEQMQNGGLSWDDAKEKARRFWASDESGMQFILDREGEIVFGDSALGMETRKMLAGSDLRIVDEGQTRYLLEDCERWGWTVVFPIDRSLFPAELIEVQKYALLFMIIVLILSMQAIIFIAHNISKPIRHFAEVCKRIEGGESRRKIAMERGDEIGVLAKSFDAMIDRINDNTEELVGLITEKKVMEGRMAQADRLALAGSFAAGLAHEIRNPLAGLKVGVQAVQRRLGSIDDPDSAELLKHFIWEIDRIDRLVTNLLDFSKPRPTMPKATEIGALIRRTLALTITGAGARDIQTEVNIGTGADGRTLFAFADEGQAEQILINIATNAVESLQGRGLLKINAGRVRNEGCDWIRIVCRDNGCGIEPSVMERIFDPFFTTKPKGTGLGLAVAFKLAEENKGRIDIESKVDSSQKGTTVSIWLREYIPEHEEERGA